MANEISVRADGIAEAFFAGDDNGGFNPAWHGLGQNLTTGANSALAIEQAHLDVTIAMRPLQTIDGKMVPDMCATVRTDTGDVLGVVSDRYQIVQNRYAFNWLDSLQSNGDLIYESAGALQNMRKIWILARLPQDDEIAKGDSVKRYILFTTGHDGKSGIHACPTSVRVVCANTLRLALQGKGRAMSHKGDMVTKLAEARLYLSQFSKSFDDFRDNGRLLANKGFTLEQSKEYINRLFPEIAEEGRAKAQRDRRVNNVRSAYLDSRTAVASIKGTWWHLFNSVTQAIDHAEKSTKRSARDAAETKMMNLTDGIGAEFKEKAFAVALEMSA